MDALIAATDIQVEVTELKETVVVLEKNVTRLELENFKLRQELQLLAPKSQEVVDYNEKFPKITSQLRNESKDEFKRRKQVMYNKRAYAKRFAREKAVKKVGTVLETRVPSSISTIPSDNPLETALHKMVEVYLKIDPLEWTKKFHGDGDVRVLHISAWEYTNYPGTLLRKTDITRQPIVIAPNQEKDRSFAIQFRNANTGEWCDLFHIRPSQLTNWQNLRVKAGLGLFAARPFKAGDNLGLYIGPCRRADEYPQKRRSVYAMLFERKHTKNKSDNGTWVVDPGISPSSGQFERRPVFFGMEFLNDPNYQTRARRDAPPYNMSVQENLTVVAVTDIEKGSKLLLDYNYGQTMYDVRR